MAELAAEGAGLLAFAGVPDGTLAWRRPSAGRRASG
jgi:hypothetical protein